jgi:hypothetical protein
MKVQHYKRLQSKKGVLLFKNRMDKIKMFNMRFNMIRFNVQYTYTLEMKYNKGIA